MTGVLRADLIVGGWLATDGFLPSQSPYRVRATRAELHFPDGDVTDGADGQPWPRL